MDNDDLNKKTSNELREEMKKLDVRIRSQFDQWKQQDNDAQVQLGAETIKRQVDKFVEVFGPATVTTIIAYLAFYNGVTSEKNSIRVINRERRYNSILRDKIPTGSEIMKRNIDLPRYDQISAQNSTISDSDKNQDES